MNSNSALTFKSKVFNAISLSGQPWLTLPDIADALYRKGGDQSDPPFAKGVSQVVHPSTNAIRQVQKLFQRHADEFTPGMTALVELATAGGKQMVRVFSLRGAHLLAMFARTQVAKEFRRWVLDILDPQYEVLANAQRLDDEALSDIQNLCTQAEMLRSWWELVAPGIRALNRTLAGNVHDNFVNATLNSRSLVRTLGLKSNRDYATDYPWGAGHTERVEYVQERRIA